MRFHWLDRYSAKFRVGGKLFMYKTKSCLCLDRYNGIRELAVKIMVNKWFDRFITLCILLNSALLASKKYDENYNPNFESSWN